MGLLLLLLVLFFLLAAIVVGSIALLGWRRRGPRVTEPQCPRCGYGVRGLPSFICPECGADLREVGILAPNTARPVSRSVWALLWTLCLPVPALILTALAIAFILPAETTHSLYRTISIQTPSLNYNIDVTARSTRLRFGANTPHASPPTFPPPVVTLRVAGGNATFTYDSATNLGHLRIPNTPSDPPITFDADAIVALLVANGVDAKAPELANLAAEIVPLVQEVPQAQGGTIYANLDSVPFATSPAIVAGGTSRSIATSPPWWAFAGTAAFWLLLWIAGLLLIYRPRSRPASPSPTTA